MADIFDKNYPSPVLLENILGKVNAIGNEPRVIVEFDKMTYVPGLKSRFTVWDRILSTSIDYVQAETVDEVDYKKGDEPTSMVGGGESGDRFEYIKCSFYKAVKKWKLPIEAYYFFLAVAKHETGFGTLGQGKPANGSYIVGYGCPGSCDPAYSGIDTQTHFACKRFNDAMKSRYSAIKSRGYLTVSDIDYFHQGGDKGYNKWVWSADGANWKVRVNNYYTTIRKQQSASKWQCKSASSSSSSKNMYPTNNEVIVDGLDYEEDDTYTLEDQLVDSFKSSTVSKPVFPVEGMDFTTAGDAYVASGVGARNYKGYTQHKGIDISSRSGHSAKIHNKYVVAAWDGKVTHSGPMGTFGNVVMIKHSNGYGTVYAHQVTGSLLVRAGQYVKAGQRLGRVGDTGNPDPGAYHLHFEIWKGQYGSYNGTGFLNPIPILTGAQKIEALGAGADKPKDVTMEVVKNKVFDKCFNKDGKVSKQWVDKKHMKHFYSSKTGKHYNGFEKNVKKGEVKGFGFKHNFSADGYFAYTYFCSLQTGDSVTVSLDGVVIKRFTKSNNNSKDTHAKPIHVQHNTAKIAGANSHVLDFTMDNTSGKAVFGIGCFTVTEVDVKNGSNSISSKVKTRKRNVWIETGGFAFDKTFTVEDDIKDWEVNTHYDQTVATARITLDNKFGIYSPSYDRTINFPENRREAEMSYYENDAIRHVLSEATPVRIYAGYGENLVRVFTGRIKGEIEEDSVARTITVNCVDMYDSLEEHVFDTEMAYPDSNSGDGKVSWVKSAIVHNIANESGLVGWRVVDDDLEYPDAIIEETYYIDIDKGGKKAIVWDAKKKAYVTKKIASVKDAYGYKNPYVQDIKFDAGTRASDAIQELIGDIMYRAYCDRYGTFRLENIRNITAANAKWEFIDGENLMELTTAVDYSRIRNHLIIVGSAGNTEHFVDKDLIIATKGNMRTAQVVAEWVDERYGASAHGIKEDIADRIFFDMKRQARTFSVVVKGNPMIEVLDGCYIYDRNTSSVGYYVVKGNRLVGNEKGIVNQLELTWMDKESYYEDEPIYNIPPETTPEVLEGEMPMVPCGKTVKSGSGTATFTHKVTDKGYVYVSWYMYKAKDTIAITVGGKTVYKTSSAVSDDKGSPIGFYYKPGDGKIVVKINGGGVDYNTAWKYTLYCPGTAPKSVKDKAKFV